MDKIHYECKIENKTKKQQMRTKCVSVSAPYMRISFHLFYFLISTIRRWMRKRDIHAEHTEIKWKIGLPTFEIRKGISHKEIKIDFIFFCVVVSILAIVTMFSAIIQLLCLYHIQNNTFKAKRNKTRRRTEKQIYRIFWTNFFFSLTAQNQRPEFIERKELWKRTKEDRRGGKKTYKNTENRVKGNKLAD